MKIAFSILHDPNNFDVQANGFMMSKTPPDSPTKVGERVSQRGNTKRCGLVSHVAEQTNGLWMVIVWDDCGGPRICHQNELKLLPKEAKP